MANKAYNLGEVLQRLAGYTREEGIQQARIDADRMRVAFNVLVSGLQQRDMRVRKRLVTKALSDMANALTPPGNAGENRGGGATYPSYHGGSAPGEEELDSDVWDPAEPIEADLQPLQISCKVCGKWALLMRGSGNPLPVVCGQCGWEGVLS